MYSIDGAALSDPSKGWRFKRTSEPLVARSLDRPDFNASNRDGTIAVRGHITTPTVTLVVTAPGSTKEALARLLRMGTSITLTSDPSIALNVQILTLTPVTITPAGDGIYEYTAVYRVAPDVWWRDVATTDWSATIPQSASPGAANLECLVGTSGHVTDALVVIEGTIDTPRISGMNGTWMEYSTHLTACWIRLDAATGRCWFGTVSSGSDPWTDTGSDYTNLLNTGPYPYFLELAPTSTGPASATLGISWNSVGANTTVTVRARNAYDR